MLMAMTFVDFLDKHWDSIVDLLTGCGIGVLVIAMWYFMFKD
jgi:hypothetical protein